MMQLCTRAGFADCNSLVQRDLLQLCDMIESETGVIISLSTIKRLMNGQFANMPQIATLDAIAITAGYKNWHDFKLSLRSFPESTPKKFNNSARQKVKYIISGVLLVLVAVSVLAVMMSHKPGPANIDKAHFSATKVTGNDIPNTVVFKYNIDSVSADSFFIQQSWDKSRRVRIYKNNYTLTDIYYEPGYHNAKLIADDKVIKRIPVSIPTDRWIIYAKEQTKGSKPKYIIPGIGFKAGSLKLTPADLISGKVDASKNNAFSMAYFPSKFDKSSDDFVMKFRIRVKKLNNESCPYLMSEVFCQNDFMYYISTPKGCTSEAQAVFGENLMYGRANDLSSLGIDLTAWQDMELKVENKKVTISFNGRPVFHSAYVHSAGLITGLGFTSNGLCELQYVDLTTLKGEKIYADNF